MKPKIIVVIPTVRPEQYKSFIASWKELFEKHQVTLVTVWDGETPNVTIYDYQHHDTPEIEYSQTLYSTHKELIYRYTDACRNLGFIVAAHLMKSPNDILITLDDDVAPALYDHVHNEKRGDWLPYPSHDPIQAHIDVLNKRVPLGWMNTAHDTDLYLRGVPYNIRNESPVMLSHGVWVGTPDFDGETQVKLENCIYCKSTGTITQELKYTNRVESTKCPRCNGTGKAQVPYSLPYYVGPIPKGVLAPICGMNLATKRDALPYFYFAPMGVDTKIVQKREVDQTSGGGHTFTIPLLNRFADIWMGIHLKKEFDRLGWGCYTGGSTVLHTRASDAKKNFEQEKLVRLWNERIDEFSNGTVLDAPLEARNYFYSYSQKRQGFKELITSIFLNR